MSSSPDPHVDHAGRTVARGFLALGFGEAAARLIAFAATIVVARSLGAAMYGVVGVATAITLYLNRIADGGIELGLGVREIAADPRRLETVVSSILSARLVVATALIMVTVAVGLLLLPQPDGAVLAVTALGLVAVGGGARWVHIGFDRSRYAALGTILGQTLAAGLLIALVRGPGDVARVPTAQLAGDSLAAILFMYWLSRRGARLPVRIDPAVIRPLLPRARSLVLSAILGLMIYNADFIFLRVLSGARAVGYYNAAYTLVTFFLNIGIAYSLSLLPSLTRLTAGGDEQHRLYHNAMAHVFAAGWPIALGGSLLASQIVGLLFGGGYARAAVPFAILIWCIPLNLLRDVPLMALMARGREHRVLQVTAWAAGLNLVLNILLIPRYATAGAAWASVITETIRMILAHTYARAEGYRLTAVGRFARAGGAGLGMVLVLWLARAWPVLALVPLGGMVYVLALWGLGGIRFRRGQIPALTV